MLFDNFPQNHRDTQNRTQSEKDQDSEFQPNPDFLKLCNANMELNDRMLKPANYKETEEQRKRREDRERKEAEQQQERERLMQLMMDPNNNDF